MLRRRHATPPAPPQWSPPIRQIHETYVAAAGLAVMEVAAADDTTAFAVQELLAARCAIVPAKRTRRVSRVRGPRAYARNPTPLIRRCTSRTRYGTGPAANADSSPMVGAEIGCPTGPRPQPSPWRVQPPSMTRGGCGSLHRP
ncbi:DUF6207 family protein [Streptomyces sp. IBSBF 2806]|uniref:DUF6207 family protein n=1 Tax=Streptomyces sp. IBSBF 2806 TaxID=2903529 RepID=UPI002FDBEDA1